MTYITDRSCQIGGLGKIYEKALGFKRNGFFVEVGAYNGITYSNTSCFAAVGWKGIMIEPDPDLFLQCQANYSSNLNVLVLQCAAGETEGRVTLYRGDALSTTSKDMVDVYKGLAWSKDRMGGLETQVDMLTLDRILSENGCPVGFDVLTIDTEGTDLQVLRGANLERWQPKLVIVEACEKHPDQVLAVQAADINQLFDDLGYDKIFCDSINSIFVRRK